jgi:hypothetical protein
LPYGRIGERSSRRSLTGKLELAWARSELEREGEG